MSTHVLKSGRSVWKCSCVQWSFDPEVQRTGRSGVLEHERRLRAVVEMTENLETGLLSCDEKCGALRDPVTLEECRQTVRHYQKHHYLSGCSACGS